MTAHGWIDPDRLGVAGGSYGGYMVNWMIGHTQRFRAAVALRSTCDRYSQWGTSDMGMENGRWEFPGDPWTAADFYRERSPHHVRDADADAAAARPRRERPALPDLRSPSSSSSR